MRVCRCFLSSHCIHGKKTLVGWIILGMSSLCFRDQRKRFSPAHLRPRKGPALASGFQMKWNATQSGGMAWWDLVYASVEVYLHHDYQQQ